VALSTRLAMLDLGTLDRDSLERQVEREAEQLFGLQSARLVTQKALKTSIGDPHRTASGLDIPIGQGIIRGRGAPKPGWEQGAREFAVQVTVLLQTHDALMAKRRHETELAALYETVGQLTANLEVEIVLQTIVARARELLGAELAYITLLDRAQGVVRMRVSVGHRSPAFTRIVLPIGAGIGGFVADTGRPAYTHDYLNDAQLRHHPATDDVVRQEAIRSILGVPLKGRSGVLGVLFAASRTAHVFTEHDVRLLSSLGNHAAVALENARLYQEARSAAEASRAAELRAEAHLRELQRIEEVHERLTETILAGEGFAGVAAVLAAALDAEVVLTGWRFTELASAGPGGRAVAQLPSGLVQHVSVQSALQECAREYKAASVGEWLIAPVVARHEIMGYIWLRREGRAGSATTLRPALEQAASVVALEMLRERAERETEHRLRREYIQELLSQHPPAQTVLHERLQQVWSGFGLPRRPALMSVTAGDGAQDALAHARAVVAEARPRDFVGRYGDRLVMLLTETDREAAAEEVQQLGLQLQACGLHASFVIGGVCRTLTEDRETLLIALQLEQLLGPRPVVWMEGMEVLTVLFDPSHPERLQGFVRSVLAPLADQPALLSTLETFFQCGGNRALAARRLGLHVNTLRYRLERIEALLGGPIGEPARSVSLQLALLARGAAPVVSHKTDPPSL
jgi:sugar diacid utilization regulator